MATSGEFMVFCDTEINARNCFPRKTAITGTISWIIKNGSNKKRLS